MSLKAFLEWPIGENATLSWGKNRQPLIIKIRRMENSVFIFTDSDMGYHINFEQTHLTFGTRHWFKCPACNGRSGVLYHSNIFACRGCLKLTYESQNGSKLDAISSRIRRLRKRLWPNLPSEIINDLSDSCHYWPKPQALHRKTFARRKAIINTLEKRLAGLIGAQVKALLRK